MSENGVTLSRRSSSQTSRTSTESKKGNTLRAKTHRNNSRTSHANSIKTDPSLTSFPSFSPELASREFPSVQLTDQGLPDPPVRSVSQKVRDRKATLAGLTNGSPAPNKQKALFDDTPRSSFDIPGSLHLASDEHIERFIVRAGAVNLIRQYAQDLAQRDAELSTLRMRADNRERELKKLLREANVANVDIEKTLRKLEQSAVATDDDSTIRSPTSLDGLMIEAMEEDLSNSVIVTAQQGGSGLAIEAAEPDSDGISPFNQDIENPLDAIIAKKSVATSRATSRASSVGGQRSPDFDATIRPRAPSTSSNQVSALQNVFQAPTQSSSYFIGGYKSTKKAKAVDEVSVRSNQSGRSFASWTNIFGGKSTHKARSASIGHDSQLSKTPTEAQSLLAAAAKLRPHQMLQDTRSSTPIDAVNASKSKASGRHTPSSVPLATSPQHVRKESNTGNVPPTVELDSMIESSQLPPTMTLHHNDHEGLMVDRFGFIYDQKRRKRQAMANSKHRKNKSSVAETIASHRSRDGSPDPVPRIDRPHTPRSMDDDGRRSWQDYLKVTPTASTSRPRELLFHTPSASAVVTVNSGSGSGNVTPDRSRAISVSLSTAAQKALPTTSLTTESLTANVTTVTAEPLNDAGNDVSTDPGPSKLLLDQLLELHDSLQNERTVRWNDFLRKVRAERANNIERGSNNAPEAEWMNGELIGLATAGRSAKTRNKYFAFKSLVLSGIPVTLRPKIWAECSGATTLRIPGYYEDLVARSESGQDIDHDIAQQIDADIRRTLTDNVFFRSGPGVQRLQELLRAYSIHNPRIGYCQGMNLITASLLLICATPEDSFWLLVAIIDHILPSGYFDRNLLVSRADQIVLRQYVAEVLPRLDAKLTELDVNLEVLTFHWFLSLYTGVLTGGEALYRIWDVVICLNSLNSNEPNPGNVIQAPRPFSIDAGLISVPPTPMVEIPQPNLERVDSEDEHDGTGSAFLFQLSLALLKLNENAILGLESAAQVYSYINHNMTNHAISIDALVQASEALRARIQMAEVLERRRAAVKSLGG